MDLAIDGIDVQRLRDHLRPFLGRRNALAVATVAVDVALWAGATILGLVAESIWLKAIFSATAGLLIGTLFVLGHDAVHNALTSSPRLNALLGRIAFLPSLHNVTLWAIQHNRLHHRFPNVQGFNSWSPYSLQEFRALPAWRRALERLYRCGLGTGAYYLIERWWKDKFLPIRDVDPAVRRYAWRDAALLLAWLAMWLGAAIWIAARYGSIGPLAAVLWGFVVPFAVWNQLMGFTVLLQHTHPSVRWYKLADDARASGGQELRTIHVQYPAWYGFLTHYIMEHPAHHLNPTIPFYHLKAAQQRLNEVLGPAAFVEPIHPVSLTRLIRGCKLYDYERHAWLDFRGRQTWPTRGHRAAARQTQRAAA